MDMRKRRQQRYETTQIVIQISPISIDFATLFLTFPLLLDNIIKSTKTPKNIPTNGMLFVNIIIYYFYSFLTCLK